MTTSKKGLRGSKTSYSAFGIIKLLGVRCERRHKATLGSLARARLFSPHFALTRTGRGGRRQNPIRADHLRRATGLSMFGLLDYPGWPRRRLHSPRAERMTEKSAVTPSAISVQTKKNAPLELAMLPPTPRR